MYVSVAFTHSADSFLFRCMGKYNVGTPGLTGVWGPLSENEDPLYDGKVILGWNSDLCMQGLS